MDEYIEDDVDLFANGLVNKNNVYRHPKRQGSKLNTVEPQPRYHTPNDGNLSEVSEQRSNASPLDIT